MQQLAARLTLLRMVGLEDSSFGSLVAMAAQWIGHAVQLKDVAK